MMRHYYDSSVTVAFTGFRPSLSSSEHLGLYVGASFVISLSLRAGSNESLSRKYYRSHSHWTQAVVSSPVGYPPVPP